MTYCLDLVGDMLTLDHRPVASLAHLDPGFRDLVRERIVEMIDTVAEPELLDLRGCEVITVVLDDDGNMVGRYFPGPPLPDGWQISTLVYLHEIESACEEAEIEVQKPEVEEPPARPVKRKRKK